MPDRSIGRRRLGGRWKPDLVLVGEGVTSSIFGYRSADSRPARLVHAVGAWLLQQCTSQLVSPRVCRVRYKLRIASMSIERLPRLREVQQAMFAEADASRIRVRTRSPTVSSRAARTSTTTPQPPPPRHPLDENVGPPQTVPMTVSHRDPCGEGCKCKALLDTVLDLTLMTEEVLSVLSDVRQVLNGMASRELTQPRMPVACSL
jgi:hypothetical protein